MYIVMTDCKSMIIQPLTCQSMQAQKDPI